MMPHLRCMVVDDEGQATHGHEVQFDLAVDPAHLLFTLNVCWLVMPSDTDPMHLENWREIEGLLHHLSALYAHHPAPRTQRRVRVRWRHRRAPD